MHVVTAGPCQGPNHGNPSALPLGNRMWHAGHLLSLTQRVAPGDSRHMLFCSPDCLCDWHGAHAALAVDNADNPAFEILGSFRLIWCSPPASSVGDYDDWEALTEEIGGYQQRLLKLQDASERANFRKPYEA
jgi:hypothetical protein